jgi:hypothetical protein
VTSANPGDFIYARDGRYAKDNAMVTGASQDASSKGATSCPEGGKLTQGYCYYDNYSVVGINDFSGWASNTPQYSVRSGTADNPITLKAYPDEHPIFDTSDFSKSAISIGLKPYWTIDGFEIIGGKINIGGGTTNSQVHDITIENNNIHDINVPGGNNPGIIRIDRGDKGGPYNIFIKNNILHDIYDIDQPGNWASVTDMQHFAAVTAISRQEYFGFDGGGTGYIEITGNEIYHCPQAFFFKNPMAGPVKIENNIIYDNESLGTLNASNIQMNNNLVYDVAKGFWQTGGNGGGPYSSVPEVIDITGQNEIITNNTFIGLNSLLGIREGSGHHIENNVFFGMNGRVKGADWNTTAYIAKTEYKADPLDPSQSSLQGITSDENCFVAPYDDFQFVARYIPPKVTGTGNYQLDHFTKDQADSIFNFDKNSKVIIETNPDNVFNDPSNLDYTLKSGSQCAGMGYNPSGAVVTPPVIPPVTPPPSPPSPTSPEYTLSDFANLANDWLKSKQSSADLNVDGIIDTRDLGIMMSKWGN